MIRTAVAQDYDALGDIMFRAIRTGPSPYTEAQRRAWIASAYRGTEWQTKLARQHVVLAEGPQEILGFMSIANDGYLDLAFILPVARGRGLFRQLYNRLEAEAIASGLTKITTHASLMAEPAFAALGFTVIQRETVQRACEQLCRAEMAKSLQR